MQISDIRILFYGTADFAVAALEGMYEAGCTIVGVVTAPDRPAGRGHKLQSSPVKLAALDKGLPIFQPEKLTDEEFVRSMHALEPTLGVVVAFRMLPEILWSLPPMGTINLHASLLPDYRGAAPINWALIDGNQRTGNTLFALSHAIDTGDIWDQVETDIFPEDNFETLYNRLKVLGAHMLVANLREIAISEKTPKATPQVLLEKESACRPAPKLHKENTKIDWSDTACAIHHRVRGLSPIPAAWSWMRIEGQEESLLVKFYATQVSLDAPSIADLSVGETVVLAKGRWAIRCGDALLEIVSIKPQGKKLFNSSEFINGYLREGQPAVLFF